jgi:hypothetical protein
MAVGGPAVSSTAMTEWVDMSLAMMVGITSLLRPTTRDVRKRFADKMD